MRQIQYTYILWKEVLWSYTILLLKYFLFFYNIFKFYLLLKCNYFIFTGKQDKKMLITKKILQCSSNDDQMMECYNC